MNEKILRNLVRIGTVSSVNETKGTVQVTFEDKDNIVSDDLPLFSSEYEMPNIEDQVVCIFLGNGLQTGFCLGKYYDDDNLPPATNKNVYYKSFLGEGYMKYDKTTNTLTLNAQNIVFEGNLIVAGNIRAEGDVEVTGSISASNLP